MKKALILLLVTFYILVGCHSSVLSFSEISVVPGDVQDQLTPNVTLQLLNESEDISYIVFHS